MVSWGFDLVVTRINTWQPAARSCVRPFHDPEGYQAASARLKPA